MCVANVMKISENESFVSQASENGRMRGELQIEDQDRLSFTFVLDSRSRFEAINSILWATTRKL